MIGVLLALLLVGSVSVAAVSTVVGRVLDSIVSDRARAKELERDIRRALSEMEVVRDRVHHTFGRLDAALLRKDAAEIRQCQSLVAREIDVRAAKRVLKDVDVVLNAILDTAGSARGRFANELSNLRSSLQIWVTELERAHALAQSNPRASVDRMLAAGNEVARAYARMN